MLRGTDGRRIRMGDNGNACLLRNPDRCFYDRFFVIGYHGVACGYLYEPGFHTRFSDPDGYLPQKQFIEVLFQVAAAHGRLPLVVPRRAAVFRIDAGDCKDVYPRFFRKALQESGVSPADVCRGRIDDSLYARLLHPFQDLKTYGLDSLPVIGRQTVIGIPPGKGKGKVLVHQGDAESVERIGPVTVMTFFSMSAPFFRNAASFATPPRRPERGCRSIVSDPAFF